MHTLSVCVKTEVLALRVNMEKYFKSKSNSGRAVCRRTKHEATDANGTSLFLTMSRLLQCNLKGD